MTGSYKLLLKKSAERELRKIPKTDLQRITERIKELAVIPRPSGSEKLAGQDSYRIRQGDYRVVYTVDDDQELIEIIKIGHRREVYR
ncbi:MAG TPA: type II toxin-antitoxin system RelE/ParE family toxin [Nitrospiraceae bacterium]|nr:type II toxin-antitoxin system RelE/ParE family toxin [Nitrospiraceae bacterium]